MSAVTNYFPNPDLRTSERTTFISFNDFRNPTPTVDLTYWSAVPGGSIERRADASLFDTTTHGCRVVNGVNLQLSTTPGYGRSVTVKVRAGAAMTITGTATAAEAPVIIRAVGWGDAGWGVNDYTEGAAKSFAAGEECLFRIYLDQQGSVPYSPVVTLTATGTFDVDGVMEGVGVNDGYGTPDGESVRPPGVPLFFHGDAPAANGITYQWAGTPHDSTSLAIGAVPKYTNADYSWTFEIAGWPDEDLASSVFCTTLDGENVAAIRGAIGFGMNELLITDADGVNFAGLGLTVGGKYALTIDVISDHPLSFYGYLETSYGEGAVYGSVETDTAYLAYHGLNGISPYRKRIVLPFTYQTDNGGTYAEFNATHMNWATGDLYITNVGIYDVEEILVTNATWNLDDGVTTKDLMALGVQPGGAYRFSCEFLYTDINVWIEYRVGAGAWVTLGTQGNGSVEEYGVIINAVFEFTVPADATEVRFRTDVPGEYFETVTLTTPIPAPFTGDTPDGGGYFYSWAGTPGDSASIRATEPETPLDARVFTGGEESVRVTHIRIVSGGVLVPVTEIGE